MVADTPSEPHGQYLPGPALVFALVIALTALCTLWPFTFNRHLISNPTPIFHVLQILSPFQETRCAAVFYRAIAHNAVLAIGWQN